MGQDIFKSDMLRRIFVDEDEILAYQLIDWRRPLDVGVFLIVRDDLSQYRRCESLGGAACVEEGGGCDRRRRER